MRRLLIATALLIVAPMVVAQTYKWTDANGTVHYADAPPPSGTKYSKVTTSGTVEPLAAPAPASNSGSNESTAAKPSQPAKPPLPMADTPENRVKLCNTLKGNLDALKSSGPVVLEENGQQKVMDANQRQQQQASATAQYQQYCPGG